MILLTFHAVAIDHAVLVSGFLRKSENRLPAAV
jgi:hypothetical protein